MSVYIQKNNQQLGPFEKLKVMEMLKSGELSPNDSAIRHGENEWQKLSDYFPNAGNDAPAEIVFGQPAAFPRRRFGGSFLVIGLIGILIAGVLGVSAYRNMYPADSTENLPDSVKDFKLGERPSPNGNIWGTETRFVGYYKNSSKSQSMLYRMIVYNDETTAKEAMRTELNESCRGKTPLYFSFSKNGTEMSQGATCGSGFYIQKDNKLVTIGGPTATVETITEFAENLPFNAGTTMIKKPNK